MNDQAESPHFFRFYPMLIFYGYEKYEGLGNIDNDLHVFGDIPHLRPHFCQDLGQRGENDGIYRRICSDLGMLLVGDAMMAKRLFYFAVSSKNSGSEKSF